MTTDVVDWPEPIEELRYALAEADAEAPPVGLRARVMTTALAVRPAGRPADSPLAITPVEAYRRTVAAFDSVLGDLAPDEWTRPALRDLDVQGLVGHLIGVEHAFQAGMGLGSSEPGGTDHIASTRPFATAQAERCALDTYGDWFTVASATVEHLASADAAELDAAVTLHGVTLPLAGMLLVRSFEMWTHDEDIRRATGRPLAAPEPARLALMTQFAIPLLAVGMSRVGRSHPGHTARLVLTGRGGGTWDTPLGEGWATPLEEGRAGPATVRIIIDAAGFCRLLANRLDPATVEVVVTGDEAVAADLLAGASALAWD